MLLWLLIVVAALAGLFAFLNQQPGMLDGLEGGEIAALAGGVALLVYFLIAMSRDGTTRPMQALSYLMFWGGLMLALVAGYGYRDELSQIVARVSTELAPPGTALTVEDAPRGQTAVKIRRRGDGHFSARADVNGQTITLMVDTGASTVVLKPSDAQKLGIDTNSLSFTVPVQTANGTTYAAPVRLKRISVGPIKVENVEALVAKPGNLKESLLGMSFLRRLRSYEFSGEFLTLRS